jgi:hypothetical protein
VAPPAKGARHVEHRFLTPFLSSLTAARTGYESHPESSRLRVLAFQHLALLCPQQNERRRAARGRGDRQVAEAGRPTAPRRGAGVIIDSSLVRNSAAAGSGAAGGGLYTSGNSLVTITQSSVAGNQTLVPAGGGGGGLYADGHEYGDDHQ